MKSMKNEITKGKSEYAADSSMNNRKEGSVVKMKKLFNRLRVVAALVAFLGTTGAGMSAIVTEPVMAAESSVERVADAKSGYYLPSTITIKKGEKKVVNLTIPSGSSEFCNVSWQYNPNYVSFDATGGHGSYWGQPARCTITGKDTGSFTMYVTAKIFRKKGDPKSHYKTLKLTSKVNVVDATSKTTTTKTTGTNTTANKPTSVKRPLQKITLNKTSVSLNAGASMILSVGYTPANTTDTKAVKWSTSNAPVATVSGGKVTAKKAGTATITAKVGNKTASCRLTVKAAPTSKESYKNVSEAYTLTNQFRTTKSNQWYWNANNKTKTYTYGLKGLTRDVTLENTARLRAREQWTQYYVNGKKTHTRPNGKSCFTAYPKGYSSLGENLGWGQTSCRVMILDGNYGWAETNKKYADQGHRRNMLNSRYKKVGIACYEKNGKTCWAMCLGS